MADKDYDSKIYAVRDFSDTVNRLREQLRATEEQRDAAESESQDLRGETQLWFEKYCDMKGQYESEIQNGMRLNIRVHELERVSEVWKTSSEMGDEAIARLEKRLVELESELSAAKHELARWASGRYQNLAHHAAGMDEHARAEKYQKLYESVLERNVKLNEKLRWCCDAYMVPRHVVEDF